MLLATVIAEASWMIQSRCGDDAETAFIAAVVDNQTFIVIDLDIRATNGVWI